MAASRIRAWPRTTGKCSSDAEIMAEAYSLPPPIHRDPADRVLIATARQERLTLVTTDGKIQAYPHVATVC